MPKKYFGLDLFGGKKVVFERMTSMVRKSLKEKVLSRNEDYIKGWFEWGGFDDDSIRDKIYSVVEGKQEMNYDNLNMLGQALDIDINKTLENPKFTKESRKYWLNQIKENPMVIGGTRPSKSISKETELRFYIRLISISELYQAA